MAGILHLIEYGNNSQPILLDINHEPWTVLSALPTLTLLILIALLGAKSYDCLHFVDVQTEAWSRSMVALSLIPNTWWSS